MLEEPLKVNFERLTLLATVDELSSVDALSSDEEFRPLLEAVRVPEGHFGQGSTTAGVMDNILRGQTRGNVSQCALQAISAFKYRGRLLHHLHDPLDVTMAFGEVDVTEFGGTFPVFDVGFENGARTFSLSPDHTSHRVLEQTTATVTYRLHMTIQTS